MLEARSGFRKRKMTKPFISLTVLVQRSMCAAKAPGWVHVLLSILQSIHQVDLACIGSHLKFWMAERGSRKNASERIKGAECISFLYL